MNEMDMAVTGLTALLLITSTTFSIINSRRLKTSRKLTPEEKIFVKNFDDLFNRVAHLLIFGSTTVVLNITYSLYDFSSSSVVLMALFSIFFVGYAVYDLVGMIKVNAAIEKVQESLNLSKRKWL